MSRSPTEKKQSVTPSFTASPEMSSSWQEKATRTIRRSRAVKYHMDERVLIQEILKENITVTELYANIIVDISHEKLDKPFQYRIPGGTCRGNSAPGMVVADSLWPGRPSSSKGM